MRAVFVVLTRYGRRWLAAPPPGAALVLSVILLGAGGLGVLAVTLLREEPTPLALVAGLGSLAISLLVLQTTAIQLAHRDVVQGAGGRR